MVNILTCWEGEGGAPREGLKALCPPRIPIPCPLDVFHLIVPELLYTFYKLVIVNNNNPKKNALPIVEREAND